MPVSKKRKSANSVKRRIVHRFVTNKKGTLLIDYVKEKVSVMDKDQQKSVSGALDKFLESLIAGNYDINPLRGVNGALEISIELEHQGFIKGFASELSDTRELLDSLFDKFKAEEKPTPLTESEIECLELYLGIFSFQIANVSVEKYNLAFNKVLAETKALNAKLKEKTI